MKRRLLTFMVIFFSFIPLVLSKEIETARVSTTIGLILRSEPRSGSMKKLTMPYNSIIEVVSTGSAGSGCEKAWVEVLYNNQIRGYACSTYLSDFKKVTISDEPPVEEPSTYQTDEEFFEYLKKEGFPNSYWEKLNNLRKIHPNWVFKASKTKYTWQAGLNEQDVTGRSLLSVNNTGINRGDEGYLSTRTGHYTWETDTFKPFDGSTWKQVNRETLAYYMDPRNFLTERTIFMFETLKYDKNNHTVKTVETILSSAFLKQYAPLFMKAAEETGVSPLYLAALSRQEVGTSSTNIVTNGKAGVIEGVNYTGYYNFFNIGASSSNNPKLMSLKSAKNKGWNTPEKAIVGGAWFIVSGYINAGQDTSYYQKFNFSANATKAIWHQYCTNVNALQGPAGTTFLAYLNAGIIDHPIVFNIPVFEGMPEKTSLPPLGNPNNWLKELKINDVNLSGFSGSKTEYEITIPSSILKIEAATVNSKAKVTGLGTFTVNEDSSVYDIIVTAANGDKKTYTVKVNKVEVLEQDVLLDDVMKASGYVVNNNKLQNISLGTNVPGLINKIVKDNLGVSVNVKENNNVVKTTGTITTGDIVTITSKNETRVYEVIIFGDITGTGQIGIVDLGAVQKHLLNVKKLTGAELLAADINKDGKVNIVDLGMIQKHLLKISYIEQS